MKHKLFVVALCLVLACLFAYGTIAYYSVDTTATNIISAGTLSIDLLENGIAVGSELEDGSVFNGIAVTGFMPATSVDKKVEVKNTSSKAQAWVRVKIDMAFDNADTGLSTDVFTFDIDEDNWKADGDWYYYAEKLDAGKATPPLFTKVNLDGTAGNDYQGSELTVDIIAQAVQAANNGAAYGEAAGWPASSPEPTP